MDGGRRERRKAELRRRISDAATALFLRRGFDDVTVSEIAEAADVARPTVFAHFPRKEDLLFDRYPEAVELLTRSVLERPAHVSAVRALRDLLVALADEGHPLSAIREEFVPFWRLVAGSRTLQARARELVDACEADLAAALDATGTEHPELVAALITAAYRSVHLTAVREALASTFPVPQISATHPDRIRAALDLVDRATADLQTAPAAGR